MVDPAALQRIFDKVVDLPPADRRAYLDQSCPHDTALRQEVERLLAAYERLGSVLDSGSAPASAPSTEMTSEARPISLTPGARVGPYEIVSLVGAGGMGEVYRAHDPRLKRDIALKVLPQGFDDDRDRRERFTREAQAIAALNHPSIVTIHSVEHADGVHFLTMELVEGKSLGDLIRKHGVPFDQFIRLAIPLADAVSAAHERGITHRDLKPANIMVAHDGRVKVLDFGLAKAYDAAASNEGSTALPTQPLTGEGRILGTVAYMSPEQAEGKPVDHRSDIFSLGIVLYEMATGERPFKGDTNVSVLSAILKDTPVSVTDLNRSLPPELGRIIRHALVKDPHRRYQSATDLRNELEELKADLDSGVATAPVTPAKATIRSPFVIGAVGLMALGLAGIAAFVLWRKPPGSEPSPIPAPITVMQLTSRPGRELFPSLSPDGKWLIYNSGPTGNQDIVLQSVGGQNAINLTKDSEVDDNQAAFSPDGEQIVFRSERQGGGIFVMGRTGESVRRVTDSGFNPSWSPDAYEIVVSTESIDISPEARATTAELWTVRVTDGTTKRILSGDAVQPAWSPHGERIAYWGLPPTGAQRDVYTIPAAGGPAVKVTDDAALDWNPVWSPDGQYLYFSSDRGGSMNLWRMPIDEPSGRVLGPAEAVTTPSRFVGHMSFAANGRQFLYASVESRGGIRKVGFDPVRGSVVGNSSVVAAGSSALVGPRPSPDGQWLAFSGGTKASDIFVSHPDGSEVKQLTTDGARNQDPRWSPDGSRLAFDSNRGGPYNIWTINRDGSNLRRLTDSTSGFQRAVFSPDGARMALFDNEDRVALIDPSKPWTGQTPEMLPPFDNTPPRFVPTGWSPDGQYLAGNVLGPGGVIVFSLATRKYARVTESGVGGEWLNDSRRIVYLNKGKLFLVDRQTGKSREILSIPGEFLGFLALTHDNRTLYFSQYVTEADVWMGVIK